MYSYVCSAESAIALQPLELGDAEVKLGRCVVVTKIQIEFEDGSDTMFNANTH